jgi:hypothetical protein
MARTTRLFAAACASLLLLATIPAEAQATFTKVTTGDLVTTLSARTGTAAGATTTTMATWTCSSVDLRIDHQLSLSQQSRRHV